MFRGILCIIGASLAFGVMPTANRYVMTSGVSAECITFYIQTILSLLAAVLAVWKGHSLRVSRGQLLRLLLLGAVGMGMTSFLVSSACLRIPVGLATVLHFLYPTVVSVAMVAFFGQKMSRYKAMAIACSILGMLLITDLNGDGGIQASGILFALASSLTYSFYMISNEKGDINQLPLLVKLVYSSIGSAVLFGLVAACNHSITLPGTPSAACVLVFVCGCGSLLAYYLITAGIKQIGASTASFINMLEPVTSVVVSSLVYREYPGLMMILGMVLILSAVFLVSMDGRKNSAPDRAKT